MGVEGISTLTSTYAANGTQAAENKKTETEKQESSKAVSDGAVYEKTSDSSAKKATYSVNKMSQEDRSALVQQLKAEQANRQSQLVDIVNQMLNKQSNTYGKATFGSADDDFWKTLAKGDFTVDEETKKQAQEDISEDGYWGVKQTAQRMFDFASALAGDDEEQMKKMQDAIGKAFKQSEKTWGRNLPDISYQTQDKVNEMFDEYYKSKDSVTEKTAEVS